jgi:hypothetical protein
MSLKSYPTDKLKEELERREQVQKTKPAQLEELDTRKLRKTCQEYIDWIAGEVDYLKDPEHFIFEEAMMMIFGRDVWAWINENTE